MMERMLALALVFATSVPSAVVFAAGVFSAIVLLRHGVAWLLGIPPYED